MAPMEVSYPHKDNMRLYPVVSGVFRVPDDMMEVSHAIYKKAVDVYSRYILSFGEI